MMLWTRLLLARFNPLVVLIVISLHSSSALGDALVLTQAMKASTIVEIFIEKEQIRAEIEIGVTDLAAFANVLPDEIYDEVVGDDRPLKERLRTFFESDWVIHSDGQPLRGQLVRIAPAERVIRDQVTGEALAVQPADVELVIRVTLKYELHDRPQSLTIRPSLVANNSMANIGFVCYHNGLPVNDFRYLSGEVTLDLDWTDPWYSQFRNPNLRRRFNAPLSAYLYVEPYEVRKEIIVRPKDLQSWMDLGLQDDGVIPVDQQNELKKRVADFLAETNPVTIDGQTVAGRLDRIHFIRRTLRTTGIVEPAVDLDAISATLGVIFVFPIDKLPDQVSMKWELFNPNIQSIPAVASDEAGGLPSKITPDDPVLEWKNYLTNPTNPQLLTIARPPIKQRISIPILSVICGAVMLITLIMIRRQWLSGRGISRMALVSMVVTFAIGIVMLPFTKVSIADPFTHPPLLSRDAAEVVLSNLLYNVYRSFDHHDESLIYDRLEKSVAGDLLAVVYLETRKSMEVKNQGGLRISVKSVVVDDVELLNNDVNGTTIKCRWRVSGWIGHWGHIHRRENEHVAFITIADRDGMWKITSLEMIDEQPLEPSRNPSLPQKEEDA